MTSILTVKDLIGLWPTRAQMAAAVSCRISDRFPAARLVSADQVHKWASNGAIPARFHWAVIEAADLDGYEVTADDLVRLHAPAEDAA